MSDHPIHNGEVFGFDADFLWSKAFKQYSPTPDIEVNGKKFQRMTGSVLSTTSLRGRLTQTESEEGSLTVTKTVAGDVTDGTFSFELYLPNTPLKGTYEDVYLEDGLWRSIP